MLPIVLLNILFISCVINSFSRKIRTWAIGVKGKNKEHKNPRGELATGLMKMQVENSFVDFNVFFTSQPSSCKQGHYTLCNLRNIYCCSQEIQWLYLYYDICIDTVAACYPTPLGVRVSYPSKGLYIKNGKKIIL